MKTAGLGLMLERELRRMDRRGGRRRFVRALVVVFLALMLWAAHGNGPDLPFVMLFFCQLIMMFVLQPVRAAGILVQARQEGTLPLLGLTPLRPWALLAGTCCAALALAGENLLVALPLVCVAAAYGGLTWELVVRAYTILIVAAMVGTAMGACVGARGDRLSTGAFMRALSWMLLYFLLPLICTAVFQLAGWDLALQAVESTVLSASLSLPGWRVFLPLAFNVALALILFAVGVRRLARTVLQGEGIVRSSKPRKPRVVPQTQVVAWRERTRAKRRTWIRPGFIAVGLLVLFFGASASGMLVSGQIGPALAMLFVLGNSLWVILLCWGFMTGARAYVEDREDGSLVLLLTSGLSRWRIVLEKVWGAVLRGRWGLLAGWLLHTGSAVGVAVVDDRDVGVRVLTAVVGLTFLWMGGALCSLSIGQFLSVRAPSSARAQSWAAATSGVTFFVGMLVTCFFLTPLMMWSQGRTLIGQAIAFCVIGAGTVGVAWALLTSIQRRLGTVPQST